MSACNLARVLSLEFPACNLNRRGENTFRGAQPGASRPVLVGRAISMRSKTMATTKAGGKDAISKKGSEAGKHLRTAAAKEERKVEARKGATSKRAPTGSRSVRKAPTARAPRPDTSETGTDEADFEACQSQKIRLLRGRWCPWPGSNQHSLRNSILSRARLPIPPQGPRRARSARVRGTRRDYTNDNGCVKRSPLRKHGHQRA